MNMLENISLDITDGFEGEPGWTGLNSADIILSGTPWGRYLAKWRPNTEQPALVIISIFDESTEPKLSIVVKIDPEAPSEFVPIGKSESPWESDGVVFGELCEPEEYSSFKLASQAYDLLPKLIENDLVLVKYLHSKAESFCQDGSYAYGDPFDF